MNTTKLDPHMWEVYLLERADLIRFSSAEVHVMDPARERFVENWNVRIRTVVYDEAANELRITGEEHFAHIVHGVKSLSAVEDHTGAVAAIEAIDERDIQHVVRLKTPQGIEGKASE